MREEYFPSLVIVLGCVIVLGAGFIPDKERSAAATNVGTNLVTMGGTAYQVRMRYRREDD
jgi:hypothetical protein